MLKYGSGDAQSDRPTAGFVFVVARKEKAREGRGADRKRLEESNLLDTRGFLGVCRTWSPVIWKRALRVAASGELC